VRRSPSETILSVADRPSLDDANQEEHDRDDQQDVKNPSERARQRGEKQ
jgi:hypothetical protein